MVQVIRSRLGSNCVLQALHLFLIWTSLCNSGGILPPKVPESSGTFEGTSRDAWRTLVDATQLPQEPIQKWLQRVHLYKVDVQRFGVHVPFDQYLHVLCTGTNPDEFLKELRRVKNPQRPVQLPQIHDYESLKI